MLIDIILFAGPCWIMNMAMNMFYPLKKIFPVIHKADFPLDRGKLFFDGRRLFGDSQGFLSIPLMFVIPMILLPFFAQSYSIMLLKAFCVVLGDALGSFVKRRLSIARGKFLPGIDHGDYMLATAIIFVSIDFIDLRVALLSLFLTYILHPIVCLIGYNLKLKKEPL